jgi:hypothetical protein
MSGFFRTPSKAKRTAFEKLNSCVSAVGWFVAGFAASRAFFFSERSFSQNWAHELIDGIIIAAIAIQAAVFIPTLLKVFRARRQS